MNRPPMHAGFLQYLVFLASVGIKSVFVETNNDPGQLTKSEISYSPLNLAVTELGQSVLNQIADGDR
jgi:hypothetical protein